MTKQEKLDGCMRAAQDLLRDLKHYHKDLERQTETLVRVIEIIREDEKKR